MSSLTIPQRPDLRPPLLNVTTYDADAVTPGYLFLAPYAFLQAAALENEYVPFQAGPNIYDKKGVGNDSYSVPNIRCRHIGASLEWS